MHPVPSPSDVRAALDAGDLAAAAQPIVDIADGTVGSYELLARWTWDGVPVRPDQFVPLAPLQVTAAMLDVAGWWSRRSACPVFVNVDPGSVTARLVGTGDVRSGRVGLEITERGPLHPAEVELLADLLAAGGQVAVDDFGAGWSACADRAPLIEGGARVKIDRSAVAPSAPALPPMVASLLESVGADRVVCEGLDDSQLPAARRAGVRWVQSFATGEPYVIRHLRGR